LIDGRYRQFHLRLRQGPLAAIGDMHVERHFDVGLEFSGRLETDGEVAGLIGGRDKQASEAEEQSENLHAHIVAVCASAYCLSYTRSASTSPRRRTICR